MEESNWFRNYKMVLIILTISSAEGTLINIYKVEGAQVNLPKKRNMEILPTARTMDIDLSKQRTVKWGEAIDPALWLHFMTAFPVAGFLFTLTRKKVIQDLTFCKCILSFSRSKSTEYSKLQHSKFKAGKTISNQITISSIQQQSCSFQVYKRNLQDLITTEHFWCNYKVLMLNLNKAVTTLNKSKCFILLGNIILVSILALGH